MASEATQAAKAPKKGRKNAKTIANVTTSENDVTTSVVVVNPSKEHVHEDKISDDADEISSTASVDKKTKRGRKPKAVYNSMDVVCNAPSGAVSDDENIIVKLNIKDDQKEDTFDDDEIPYAYNHDYYNVISNFDDAGHKSIRVSQDDPKRTLKVIDLLKDFEEKNKNNEWPSNTSIHCYWCCSKFDNAPFGIPINFAKENFEVYGCFCSLECAAAYNFKNNHNIDEMWERYNLINLLSRRLGYKKQVKPAPDKLSLKIFGGFMDIDQFRSYTNLNRFINVNFPPMTSITQQLEEINEFDMKNDLKYIPIDNERIKKYKEKILFKRNKPLIDVKNSIESTMNLKYNTP